jgi:nucleoside phosphorylase
MGVESSSFAGGALSGHFAAQCLAMCAVCAGRPEWTSLGDVIIADRVYRYDVGEMLNSSTGMNPQFRGICSQSHFVRNGDSVRSALSFPKMLPGFATARFRCPRKKTGCFLSC